MKYLILGQFFDVPDNCLGDYYIDICVNEVFTDKESAEKELKNYIADAIQEYSEEVDDEFYTYYSEENGIYRKAHGDHAQLVSKFWIQEIALPVQ